VREIYISNEIIKYLCLYLTFLFSSAILILMIETIKYKEGRRCQMYIINMKNYDN
jgi:hypothetical protein